MKVDFIKIKVEATFGEYKEMSIARVVGSAIHQNASGTGIDETAHNIYHSKEKLEIPDEQISIVICALSNASTIPVSARKAALNLLRLT